MRFYYAASALHATKAEACKAARDEAVNAYHDSTVDLVEISPTRDTILRMANDQGGYMRTVQEAVYTAKAKLVRGVDDV
jgi:hypothetical protein